jgi:hypothetical protein
MAGPGVEVVTTVPFIGKCLSKVQVRGTLALNMPNDSIAY